MVTRALSVQGPVCARSWVLSLTMQIKRDEDNSKGVGWREREETELRAGLVSLTHTHNLDP